MVNPPKSAMQVAEFLQRQPKVQRVVYPRLANFAQRELAHRHMPTPDGSLATGHMRYFELREERRCEKRGGCRAIRRLHRGEIVHGHAGGEPRGRSRHWVENRFSMTHALVPEEERIRSGLRPGGIRLSLRLEDMHDIIADLEDPREVL